MQIDTIRASERYFDGQNDFARPLGRVTSVAIGSAHMFVSSGERASIHRYDLTGQGRETLALPPAASVRITPRLRDTFIQTELDRSDAASHSARERMLRALPYPAELPAYRRLLVDGLNRLWIESYPTPGARTIRWTVLSPDRRPLGAVSVPAAFQLHDAAGDGLIGSAISDDGVPQIWRFALDTRRTP